MMFGCIGRLHSHKPIKVAPIASCPPPRLVSKDAGAGEARYRGTVDMADLHHFGAYTD